MHGHCTALSPTARSSLLDGSPQGSSTVWQLTWRTCRLKGMDAAAAERLLPAATHALVQRLSAAQEGVRLATARSLSAIIQACLDEASVARAAAQIMGGRLRGAPPGVVGLVAGVADALGPQHMEAWPHALPGVTVTGWQYPVQPCAGQLCTMARQVLALQRQA